MLIKRRARLDFLFKIVAEKAVRMQRMHDLTIACKLRE